MFSDPDLNSDPAILNPTDLDRCQVQDSNSHFSFHNITLQKEKRKTRLLARHPLKYKVRFIVYNETILPLTVLRTYARFI